MFFVKQLYMSISVWIKHFLTPILVQVRLINLLLHIRDHNNESIDSWHVFYFFTSRWRQSTKNRLHISLHPPAGKGLNNFSFWRRLHLFLPQDTLWHNICHLLPNQWFFFKGWGCFSQTVQEHIHVRGWAVSLMCHQFHSTSAPSLLLLAA